MQESPQSRDEPRLNTPQPPLAFHPVEHADHDLRAAVGPTLGAEGRARGKLRHRSKRLGYGPFGQLLGLVVIAAIFLAIGYYLLNWFGGPGFNFLDLPLPGISDNASDLDKDRENAIE